jgi:hypothetical protein
MRITLMQALRHSPPPIEASFRRLWPETQFRNFIEPGEHGGADHAA